MTNAAQKTARSTISPKWSPWFVTATREVNIALWIFVYQSREFALQAVVERVSAPEPLAELGHGWIVP